MCSGVCSKFKFWFLELSEIYFPGYFDPWLVEFMNVESGYRELD